MAPSLGFTPRTSILSWRAHEWQQKVVRVKFSFSTWFSLLFGSRSVVVSSLRAKHCCHSVGFAVSCSLHLVEFSLAPGTTLHENKKLIFLYFLCSWIQCNPFAILVKDTFEVECFESLGDRKSVV